MRQGQVVDRFDALVGRSLRVTGEGEGTADGLRVLEVDRQVSRQPLNLRVRILEQFRGDRLPPGRGIDLAILQRQAPARRAP